MKNVLKIALVALLLAATAAGAQIAISGLPSATLPLAGTEVVPIVQGGVTRKAPASAFGGTVTWPGSGNVVVSNGTNTPASIAPTNGNCIVGSGGAWASLACPGGTAANPTATIGAAAVNGSASTYMRSDGAPALPSTLPALNGSLLTNLAAANITGTLGVANGGTAIASYTIGDMIFASGSTTLAKLADIATTNVLLSGGVGVAPSWGKVANAALSNSAITLCGTSTSLGGSLTASACLDNIGATQGQILYRNASTWVPLSPGTNGQVLTSGGASANPSWTTVTGTGTVTTLTAGPGIVFSSGSTCTTTCTISTTVNINAQGTGHALASTEAGQITYSNSGSAVAYSIVQATTTGYTAGAGWEVASLGVGPTTITAAGGSLFGNGLGTLVLNKGQYAFFASDSTNYPITAVTLPVMAQDTVLGNAAASNYPTALSLPSCANDGAHASIYATASHAWACAAITGGAATSVTVGTTTVGSGTSTRVLFDNAGVLGEYALGAVGGVTTTIAAGTSALGTSAISSGACATVVTTSATNVATTDVITAGFNGDPTGVTGYAPTTGGMLTIIAYPSANNVNFKVCNNTSSSITPGAITLNWRVGR